LDFPCWFLLFGPIDTGWTFYTLYSANKGLNVFIVSLAIFILGMSSILTGMNFIVTVHKLRAPGMTWGKLPLFVWALYATSLVQLIATPVLGITLLLLGMENLLGIGFFNPAKGGDPVLFQHLFWFYSHPAVYIMILPAFGVISELVSVHSKKTHIRIFHSLHRFPRLGTPYVRCGYVSNSGHYILLLNLLCCHTYRSEDPQLDRNIV